jgi:hypothetical protein
MLTVSYALKLAKRFPELDRFPVELFLERLDLRSCKEKPNTKSSWLYQLQP